MSSDLHPLWRAFRRRGPGRGFGRRPAVEPLEDRCTPSGGFREFPVPTPNSAPNGITTGPDGNLWFTERGGNKIGQMTPEGVPVTEVVIPSGGSLPDRITKGPDGNLWFTEAGPFSKIGRLNLPSLTFSEFPLPRPGSTPIGITTGPDGALWFTELGNGKIGRITTAGKLTEFTVPTPGSRPAEITAGPDCNLWYTDYGSNKIGRLTPGGEFAEYTIPTANSRPWGITAGPDCNLWFTEGNGNKVGRVTTSGLFAEFTAPTANSQPDRITAGPDGNVWYAERNVGKIGQVTPDGTITEFAIPTPNSTPVGITAGPDGNLWFTEGGANKVGQLYFDPYPLTPEGTALTATAGVRFAAVVASFTTDEPGPPPPDHYSAEIDWGDDTLPSTGGISFAGGNRFDIAASHTYAKAGSYTVTVSIRANGMLGSSTTAFSSADVSDGCPRCLPAGTGPEAPGRKGGSDGAPARNRLPDEAALRQRDLLVSLTGRAPGDRQARDSLSRSPNALRPAGEPAWEFPVDAGHLLF